MTWVDELIGKVKVVYFSDEINSKQSVETALKLDDLVLAVLKKNKEIEESLPNEDYYIKSLRKNAQARAFRELVEAMEKVKKKC